MSWLFGGSANQTAFDEAVDNATSELLPSGSDETLLTSLQLSDQIRSKTVDASYALKSMRRRLAHKNPNVQIQALHVLDVLVKNSGEAFLLAVGNGKDGWMSELEELCKSSNPDLRTTATTNLQNWALAFQSTSTSSALSSSDLVNLYTRLRSTVSFPPVSQAMTSNMISSLSAPEWVDSDLCQRCRTPFTLTNRKHHCRNCGGIFCGDCSSKTMKLEHLGIDQEVRVCDGCYKKLKTPGGRSASISQQQQASTLPAAVNGSKKTREELDFERAIALSLAESSSSAPSDPYAQSSSLPGVGYGYEAKPSKPLTSTQAPASMPSKQLEEEDPDLAAAIRASLAEVQPQASTSAAASAPPKAAYSYAPVIQPSVPSYELAMSEFDALDSFSNALRNPHTRSDDANELFMRADRHRGKMYRALDDAHAKSSMLNELNQKLQHAVRLYDSLLERNISKYNQPYQQAPPQQQYYQQRIGQPYQTPPTYNPQSTHYPQSAQPMNNAQNPQQYSYAQQSYPQQAYSGPPVAEHASPPKMQHSASYHQEGQAYPAQPTVEYNHAQNIPHDQNSQAMYAEQAPGSPQQQYGGPVYAGQALQAAPSNPDEQYYNAYPAEAGGEQHQSYMQNGAHTQAYESTQDAGTLYAPPSSYPAAQQSQESQYADQQHYEAAYQQPTMPSDPSQVAPNDVQAVQPPAQTSPHDHAAPGKALNGRFQGYYSAASFPAVPSMPVGGLPAAPKGDVVHHEERPHQVEQKKEEALIEF
ncbi:hypothetical protein P389DRAFT_192454 [Cystobasidium minutum MCA 4210]|uniref:uncharacterized protein n=1 Tax=Cystobasidium minutum MCA 4210 TaxID=1397322 RepID=UPI0034CF6987|eukprot:jgi/Rhomi1/192454/gm1.668_g